jgi:prepilin-type N-terminal cleavage/methylation domain-containing protein
MMSEALRAGPRLCSSLEPLRAGPQPRLRSKARRGFTLVELMVAVATGLTVGLAAFLLAKVSLGAFQQDARVNNAQHAVLMAMNRITADVKRAGFMSTPNAAADDNICQRSTLPAAQSALLVAADVYEGRPGSGNYLGVDAYGAAPNNALPAVVTGLENNRVPDRLRVSGNYMTTERIRYRLVQAAANTVDIAIETNAVQRIYRDSPPSGAGQTICRMFPANRIMRLVDGKKKDTYVRITGCNEAEAGGYLTSASVNFAPLAAAVPNVPGVCGVRNGNEAGTMNTVNIIEYSLQQVPQPFGATELDAQGLPASAASLVRWDNGPLALTTGEDTRMDLLRRELDANGNVILGTGEVVAEWAADFKLRMTYASAAGQAMNTLLVDSGFDKDNAAGEPPPPQRIRSLGIRLTTRSREPDRQSRQAGVPVFTDPLDRFEVFPSGTIRKNRMARVRTMYTEVSLPNLAGVTW